MRRRDPGCARIGSYYAMAISFDGRTISRELKDGQSLITAAWMNAGQHTLQKVTPLDSEARASYLGTTLKAVTKVALRRVWSLGRA
jgi:hypothetical protein